MASKTPLKLFTLDLGGQILSVQGEDAERFLQGMLTNDIKAFLPGDWSPGFLLNSKGKLVTLVTSLKESASKFWLWIPPGEFQKVFDHLSHYIIADDVELREETSFGAFYYLPESPLFTDRDKLVRTPRTPQAKDLIRQSVEESWGRRLIFQELGDHDEIWWKKTQSALPFESENFPSSLMTERRIDRGHPAYGVDYGPDALVLEFPFSQFISFFKGCYLGQETIARATFRGHMAKTFCRFTAQENLIADYLYSVEDPEKAVGKITTVLGHRGLGLLRVTAQGDATQLFQKNTKGERISIERIEALVDDKTYKS